MGIDYSHGNQSHPRSEFILARIALDEHWDMASFQALQMKRKLQRRGRFCPAHTCPDDWSLEWKNTDPKTREVSRIIAVENFIVFTPHSEDWIFIFFWPEIFLATFVKFWKLNFGDHDVLHVANPSGSKVHVKIIQIFSWVICWKLEFNRLW